MTAPKHLQGAAKKLWNTLIPSLKLSTEQVPALEMLCQYYSEWRNAADLREKKVYGELFLKFFKELFPRKNSKEPLHSTALAELFND